MFLLRTGFQPDEVRTSTEDGADFAVARRQWCCTLRKSISGVWLSASSRWSDDRTSPISRCCDAQDGAKVVQA